jgi:tripartite-type tricarboxylate transporter receptor subunit TctC
VAFPAAAEVYPSRPIIIMVPLAAVFLPHGRALAKERLPQAPDVPTAAEAGLPGFEISVWNGFWAPSGTPDEVVAKLNAAVESLAAPELRRRLIDLAYEMPSRDQMAPQVLGALQRAESGKWWPIIKAAKVTAQ